MLFLIPARAGSKRLKNKNRLPFCGLPLWTWSYATAIRVSDAIDGSQIYLSTDDRDILQACPHSVERRSDLCSDDSTSQALVDYFMSQSPRHHSLVLLQPTSPTRSDSLVRKLIAHGGQVRSVTDGKPNGQCYVYRKGHTGWTDIETERGHDIDTLEDFIAAEQDMLKRFQ